jgi:hypothetical protein
MRTRRVGGVGHVLAGQAGAQVSGREALVGWAISDVMSNTPGKTHRTSMFEGQSIEVGISAHCGTPGLSAHGGYHEVEGLFGPRVPRCGILTGHGLVVE